jgi:AbrB family looped-hinge helix DNA binding protein
MVDSQHMNERVQIDQSGRLVLPKHLRARLGIEGGDMLTISISGDAIELRPAKRPALRRVNRVLVFSGGSQLPVGRDFVAERREARVEELADRFGEGK